VLGSVTVIGPASMDIYLPALPEVAQDFGTSQSATQVTLTTFLLGLAAGQLLSGPLSDVHGRRRPLVAGMAVFSVASLVCSLAPSLATLAAMRFVQGAAAVAGMAIGRAIVRDLYSGAGAARYFSRLMLIVGLGPVLAPVVGGQLLAVTSWRGLFVGLALLGLVLTVVSAVLVPETLPPARRRAAGLRATARTFSSLLGDRSFRGFVLLAAFASGAVVAYLAGSSFVFEDVYGLSPQLYGLLFGANAVFMIAGAQLNAHLVGRRSPRRLLGFGVATMGVGGVGLLAVVSLPDEPLALVMVPLALLMFSWNFVQANTLALALTDHPDAAGTAAGLLGISQFAFGAAVAPLVGVGGDGTALPMALVSAVCGIAAVVTLRRFVRPASHRARPLPASAGTAEDAGG
jgi:DHA1 family bicyclomycin/chloramphenicol resistance-like MFS transporter